MFSRLGWAIALLVMVFTLGLASCGGDRDVPVVLLEDTDAARSSNPLTGTITEVSPPERIQQLKPYLDVYEPQVRIVSPQNGETLNDTTVTVELQTRDFSIYKDANLDLGPNLHLFLDDQPYQVVYDIDTPIIFDTLKPGTHTLRVFAARPWHESFKNAGAYDQVTFNVFTESPDYNPDDSQALLTYSRPQGQYGTEPIMLDFYLVNAPLHIIAQENESVPDWRIRCTVNGESFIFDRWQPIYLKGFKPGKNWVKLELIDDTGTLVDNTFNTGIQILDYAPGGQDGLSQLIRGEIPLSQAKVLVDPNYVPPTPVFKKEPDLEAPDATTPTKDDPRSESGTSSEVTPLDAAPVVTTASPEESLPSPSTVEESPSVETEALPAPTPSGQITPSRQITPSSEEPTPQQQESEAIPSPEPTAEPGMLPEIIGDPEQVEPESAPSSVATPATPNEPSEAEDSTIQSTVNSRGMILPNPNTTEALTPSSKPDAATTGEPPNPVESRQQRLRSRFRPDRLQRRTTPDPMMEPDIVREPQSQASGVSPFSSTEAAMTFPEKAETKNEPTSAKQMPSEIEAVPSMSQENASSSDSTGDRPPEESPLKALEDEADLI